LNGRDFTWAKNGLGDCVVMAPRWYVTARKEIETAQEAWLVLAFSIPKLITAQYNTELARNIARLQGLCVE
jgi:hypothetical protein